MSLLGRELATVDVARARLEELFGRALFVSEPLAFRWSDYYACELGETPVRRIIALDRFEDSSQLPEIKRTTARLEVALARPGGAREVNIDPGLLGADQLVLASSKARAHRIHLGRGVYGDLQLIHREGELTPLAWSYPDYASDELRAIFARLRELLLERRHLEQRGASAATSEKTARSPT
jgi:hypothetical protein